MTTKQDVIMEVMIAHFPGYKHSKHYQSMMVLANKIVEALEMQELNEWRRIPQVPAEPGLQLAFIEESRSALGHPDLNQATAWVGQPVRVAFNHTTDIKVGICTAIRGAPAAKYLVLDNNENDPIYLRSVQSLGSV